MPVYVDVIRFPLTLTGGLTVSTPVQFVICGNVVVVVVGGAGQLVIFVITPFTRV